MNVLSETVLSSINNAVDAEPYNRDPFVHNSRRPKDSEGDKALPQLTSFDDMPCL